MLSFTDPGPKEVELGREAVVSDRSWELCLLLPQAGMDPDPIALANLAHLQASALGSPA